MICIQVAKLQPAPGGILGGKSYGVKKKTSIFNKVFKYLYVKKLQHSNFASVANQ